MIDLIWEIFQQTKNEQFAYKNTTQEEKTKESSIETDILRRRVNDLEKRHEQLKLVTLALWSLLRDRSGLLESDLRKYVEKVDLMDGKQDGKVSTKKEQVNCRNCKRTNLNTAPVCVYCGTYNRTKPFDGA